MNKDTPILRYVYDPILSLHFSEIIFPGWQDHEKFGPCAYRYYSSNEGMNKDMAIEIAMRLKIILEIDEMGDLTIIDFS